MATMIGNMPYEISKIIHDFIRPELDERFTYTIVWTNGKKEEKMFYKVENADDYQEKIMKLPNHKKPVYTICSCEQYNKEDKSWIIQKQHEIKTHYISCYGCRLTCCNIDYGIDSGEHWSDYDSIKCEYCDRDFCDDCIQIAFFKIGDNDWNIDCKECCADCGECLLKKERFLKKLKWNISSNSKHTQATSKDDRNNDDW